MVIFLSFCFKNVHKYLFYGAFQTSTKICPKKEQKNDNFSHFVKHRLPKKVVLQLPFWPTIGVFQLVFFETKNIRVEQKHNWKSGKIKDKKGISKRRQDRKQKKTQDWWIKTLQLNIWMLVFFMKQKQRRQKKKAREKKKEPKESKKRKTRRKKERKEQDRERERQRKRNWTGGRPNKAQEKQMETLKNRPKKPF